MPTKNHVTKNVLSLHIQTSNAERVTEMQQLKLHLYRHHVLLVSVASSSSYRPNTIVLKNGETYTQQKHQFIYVFSPAEKIRLIRPNISTREKNKPMQQS